MKLQAIKNSLGIIGTIDLNWDNDAEGNINKEWASAFLPEKRVILSVPAEVVKVLNTSENLHLVAKGDILVKDVPYQRLIIAEHKEIDPERVIGSF